MYISYRLWKLEEECVITIIFNIYAPVITIAN